MRRPITLGLLLLFSRRCELPGELAQELFHLVLLALVKSQEHMYGCTAAVTLENISLKVPDLDFVTCNISLLERLVEFEKWLSHSF